MKGRRHENRKHRRETFGLTCLPLVRGRVNWRSLAEEDSCRCRNAGVANLQPSEARDRVSHHLELRGMVCSWIFDEPVHIGEV